MATRLVGLKDVFVTIPTAGSHPDLLRQIVDDCGVPRDRIVLVRTKPGVRLVEGCEIVDDFGAPNIQRWWNSGIDVAVARGAAAIAVINDDISLSKETLRLLHAEMSRTGATVATPTRPGVQAGLHKGPLIPYKPVLLGCLWLLDLRSGLRPNEEFVWYFGDVDLDIRARQDHAGVVSADVEFHHHFPGVGTGLSTFLLEKTVADERLFEAKYSRIMAWTRFLKMGLGEKINIVRRRLLRDLGFPVR
jgi:hypothetical protein